MTERAQVNLACFEQRQINAVGRRCVAAVLNPSINALWRE
jgi:hypothetical protein